MTWVYLTSEKRDRIARQTGPYVADSFEPHEVEVRSQNPRDNWRGLTKEERQAVVAGMPKPFLMHDMLAAIEAKLKEKNSGQ